MRRVLAALVALVFAVPAVGFVGASPAAAETTSGSSSETVTPLIVLLDISGSMNDQVNSIVKLQAAKRSLEPTIRSEAPKGQLAIWAYPEDADCGAGSYVVNRGTTNVTGITAQIDRLAADGNTPTAAALEAVVAGLTANGVQSANLVLVSDGESNCGEDPCDVASTLAGTGFDLTIQSVGFDISSGGRSELECIANATGGRYFDVDDGAGLEDVMEELSTPQLTLDVTADDVPFAGQPMTITATIANPSAIDAKNVNVNLAFKDAGTKTIFPAVVPPTIRIGGIPPGGSTTRSWQIVPGERGVDADAAYRVSAWADGSPAVRVDRAFSVRATGYTSDDMGDVLASLAENDRSLVILGDSYSSGEGAGSYLKASDDAVKACHRSKKTYLGAAAARAGIDFEVVACSGAVMNDLYGDDLDESSKYWRATRQLTQLENLDSVPGAVAMTLGGNDLGFAKIVAQCVNPLLHYDDPTIPFSCTDDQAWVDEQFLHTFDLQTDLTRAYESVWRELNTQDRVKQRDGEYAPLIISAYPQLAHDYKYGPCGSSGFNTSETKFVNQLDRSLNASIKTAVSKARDDGYEVYFVDRTESAFLPSHTVCEDSTESWVNHLSLTVAPPGPVQDSFHPTENGYISMTNAIIAWSITVERVPPTAAAKRDALNHEIVPDFVTGGIAALTPTVTASFDGGASVRASTGQQLAFTASGFQPLSLVTITLHSTPSVLGSFTADEDGTVDSIARFPDSAQTGAHELVISGLDANGTYLEKTIAVNLVPPTPIWVIPVIVLSILLALLAPVCLLVARRLRRRELSAAQ